ncbi:MAG: hypothetical protein NWF14_09320 [Candidatus Bathyarchaeota archaeon]|nr:hypothetical protein [Candidatus Bathyarchaeota archaeon]
MGFFENLNRKMRSNLRVWYIRKETSEHFNSLTKVFKWIILPISPLYVFLAFYFFRENALDSMFWGILIFFYSSFLPDLPALYREKKRSRKIEHLQWYKKYALLIFAPLLIWLLFSGVKLRLRTVETFHNFKSLAIYSIFLLLLGFLSFVDFPLDIGDVTEVFSLPFYGMIGYLTHLKVDAVW